MRIEPEISGVTIVFVGRFNPAIFTPAWFALHGLLAEGVAEDADVQVTHRQVTAFKTDWLNLQVTVDRFTIDTTLAPYVRLCDLAVRVFKEHLFHTPLNAFGINLGVHFRVRSSAVRDQIGRTLAPIEPWGAWAEKLGLDGESGGMTSLTMTQVNPEGRPAGGRINVTVEPSNRIGEGRTGVYVNVNDHYEAEKENAENNEPLMELLENNFQTSLVHSEGIIDHVMSLAAGEGG